MFLKAVYFLEDRNYYGRKLLPGRAIDRTEKKEIRIGGLEKQMIHEMDNNNSHRKGSSQ